MLLKYTIHCNVLRHAAITTACTYYTLRVIKYLLAESDAPRAMSKIIVVLFVLELEILDAAKVNCKALIMSVCHEYI